MGHGVDKMRLVHWKCIAITRLILVLNIGVLPSCSCTTIAFQFPKIKFVGISAKEDSSAPQILVQNGPEDAENLRRRLETHCDVLDQESSSSIRGEVSISTPNDLSFRWEPHLRESYEVADVTFQEIARVLRDSHACEEKINNNGSKSSSHMLFLSFPSMSRPEDLVRLSDVLNSDKCKQLLGLKDAFAELYPSSPAPYLRITLSACNIDGEAISEKTASSGDIAISATKDWVNSFLGKYRLCPYTSSVSRAAVGLSSVGVPVGEVHLQLGGTNREMIDKRSYNRLMAADLASAFWSEVVFLIQSSQEEFATSLVVFPEYDSEFESFVEICDSIVEPTVVATKSTDIIGRAWFHPQYDADAVGHSEVIAGHAVPHNMVDGFMKSLDDASLLRYDALVAANNRVRRTPHATINILRRSQLTAAGEYEKGLGKKRPKANSIYVRNAVRLSKAINSNNAL
mmetsp:Transcript_14274/g.34485  ORF Transcript_14274/g.34485 Transcript_14274/m.34485 type:complete len:457 (+) Transcript_14274:114-1484(+)